MLSSAVRCAASVEVLAQGFPGVMLLQHGLVARGDVEVDQRDGHLVVAVPLTEHPAIGACLRPVQCAVVSADGVEVAPKGLDLFHPGLVELVAVGPAAHMHLAAGGFEPDLAFVVAAAPVLHQRVAGHAFERAGRGHEAQVEVARLRAKGAQGLDGNGVRDRREGFVGVHCETTGWIYRCYRRPGPRTTPP